MNTLAGRSRTPLMLASALAALVVAAILWPTDGNDTSPNTPLGGPATPHSSGAAPAAAPAAVATATDTFDQAARLLELGVAGDIRVDENTRGALDVLLASLSTPPTAAELDQLEAALRRAMPGEAATQAIALVRNYASYTQAMAGDAAGQQPPTSLGELNALLDRTIALRRKHFDAETAQALFGNEEAQTRHVLALQAIESDTRLSAADKAARAKALRAQLPPEAATQGPPTSLALSEMEDKIAALQRQGAGPAQIEQVRQRYLGAEAAQALGEMEQQRERWESRYQAFLQQKKALGASGAADMAAQVDALLRQHYSDEELAAAKAYDRAHHP